MAVVFGLAAIPATAPDEGMSAAPPARPNIVVITTDDQSMHSFSPQVMPKTFRLMEKGTSFENGLASPPLCCPDRAGFLTGQYPHNHGVRDNRPGYAKLRGPGNTLPVWLDSAGYRTGFVGKYLNGTSDVLGPEAAPGWDSWYALTGQPAYFGTAVSDQGTAKTHSEETYVTTRLNRAARTFVKQSVNRKPFFLWLAQVAPHAHRASEGYCQGSMPQPLPEDLDGFERASLPPSPSYNEADVSDKPDAIRNLEPLSPIRERRLLKRYRCTLAAMQEVDRGVGELARVLRHHGALSNTIIIFTSDNGVFFGEHRISKGKSIAYEEAFRVPLLIRAPKEALDTESVKSVAAPVAQIDFAPTLLRLARAEPCEPEGSCRRMDGRSLLGLLKGQGEAWPADRGVLAEAGGLARLTSGATSARSFGGSCGFAALRTGSELFSITGEQLDGTCASGFEEFYDLETDPFELENGIGDPLYQDRIDGLRERLQSLRSCTGILGRDEPEAGRPFCE